MSPPENTYVEAAIDRHGLPALTEETTTDPDDLRRERRSIRDRGLAFDRGGHRPGWQCVVAPVLVDGRAIGAITVSDPIERMSGKTLEEDVAGLVVSTSNAVAVAYLSERSVRYWKRTAELEGRFLPFAVPKRPQI